MRLHDDPVHDGGPQHQKKKSVTWIDYLWDLTVFKFGLIR